MDIIPIESLGIVVTVYKILLVVVASIIVLISYFQSKEARRMESKLHIYLPGSISLAVSAQFILSVFFLFVSVLFLMFV